MSPAHAPSRAPLTSVVVAAHDEAAVIGQNLDALLRGTRPGELDVVVVANGCTDDTAAVAAARGVRVLDLPRPGKAAALDAGDEVAHGFPRVYLDADVGATADTVRALARALATPGPDGRVPLVAVPARSLVLEGRPLAVRCYFAIQSRLPAATTGLYGRGMIAVSEAGRARFDRFPAVLADDLFLDSLFGADERVVVTSVRTTVETPRRTRDLLRRLTRVRRANAALRAGPPAAATDGAVPAVRPARRLDWLGVVAARPWLAPAAAVFVVLTLVAAARARRPQDGWESDRSTREVPVGAGAR